MQRKYFVFFFLLSTIVFAQEYLNPIQKISFGLNNHTNRDISYFSTTDNFGNIYNIGTTERDSSFTDIITSKFDTSLNLIWQKRYSLDTGLSYDVPLASYLDSNNNLIVLGRSSFKQSDRNGLIFIVKYDLNGGEIWNRTIGKIDGSDYYDYKYFNSYFENDILRITYVPFDWDISNGDAGSEINFLKVDSDGTIVQEFKTYASNDGIQSAYKNGTHYTLVWKGNSLGDSEFYLIKIALGIDENYQLNGQTNYVKDNFTQDINQIQIRVDNNENVYLIKPNPEGYNYSLSYTKINKLGQIEYSKSTLSAYNLLGSYIDTDQRLCLVYEDDSVGKIFYKKLDDLGNDFEIISVDYNNLSGSKLNEDNTLFVVDNNDKISLLNKDLSLINNFNYSASFPITDISKINESNIIVTGTTYEKMYPESDFYSQNNIVLEKLNPSQILNTYSFSGEGTSKAFQQKLLVDNNDNYIVLSQEKLGPDNLQIGGSRAPLKKSVSKYDSDFNLLWNLEIANFIIGLSSNVESNVVIDLENNIYINSSSGGINASPNSYELIKISPDGDVIFKVPSFQNRNIYIDNNYDIGIVSYPIDNNITLDDDTYVYTFDSNTGNLIETNVLDGLEFLKSYKSPNGDSYLYMYTGSNTYGDTNPRIDVYKNLSLDFSVNIAITGTYGSIDYLAIDIAQNGDLFFGSSWGQINEKIHKITLSNTYSYINVEHRLSRLKVLSDGKIFTVAELISNNEGLVKIYNDNLNLFSSSSDIVFNYSEILEINGNILLNSYYDNLVKVVNQQCTLIDEFKIPSNLSYSVLDSSENIILTGQFGNQIYIFHEYSWARGLLHKYEYKGPQDSDGDGIGDNIDLCNNTPIGETVNSNGCSESQLDDDSDGVMNNVDQCLNTPFGEIVDENGCSESQKDDDGDGIMNNVDECPNTKITNLVNSKGCFELPPNNFAIESISETCPNKNNGKIVISAINNLDYNVSINGVNYSFSNNLTVENLAPGIYNFCIKIELENFEQCYSIDLAESTPVSGKTSVNSGKVSINIEHGTAPYNISINGGLIFQTMSSSFSVDAVYGDLIEVSTSKSCEGVFSKKIDLADKLIASPNPTTGDFEISLPILDKEIIIELFTIQSQLISTSKYRVINGKVNISLKDQQEGIYFVKVYLEETVNLKIIKH